VVLSLYKKSRMAGEKGGFGAIINFYKIKYPYLCCGVMFVFVTLITLMLGGAEMKMPDALAGHGIGEGINQCINAGCLFS